MEALDDLTNWSVGFQDKYEVLRATPLRPIAPRQHCWGVHIPHCDSCEPAFESWRGRRKALNQLDLIFGWVASNALQIATSYNEQNKGGNLIPLVNLTFWYDTVTSNSKSDIWMRQVISESCPKLKTQFVLVNVQCVKYFPCNDDYVLQAFIAPLVEPFCPLVAEVIAILRSLKEAIKGGLMRLSVKSDC